MSKSRDFSFSLRPNEVGCTKSTRRRKTIARTLCVFLSLKNKIKDRSILVD